MTREAAVRALNDVGINPSDVIDGNQPSPTWIPLYQQWQDGHLSGARLYAARRALILFAVLGDVSNSPSHTLADTARRVNRCLLDWYGAGQEGVRSVHVYNAVQTLKAWADDLSGLPTKQGPAHP